MHTRTHINQVKLQVHVSHMVTASYPWLHPSILLTSSEEFKSSSPLLLTACLSPSWGNRELFCIQHGNLLGKRSLWNWKLNVTVWELLFVLDFVSPLLLTPCYFILYLAPFVLASFTIWFFLSHSLSFFSNFLFPLVQGDHFIFFFFLFFILLVV